MGSDVSEPPGGEVPDPPRTTPSGWCPGPETIDRVLHTPESELPADLLAHLSTCPICANRLSEARADAEFLDRVRVLVAPGLQPQDAPRIPGYQTVSVINAGAQGVVYRAMQETTSRTVAIKIIGGLVGSGSGSGGKAAGRSRASGGGDDGAGGGIMASPAISKRQRLRAEREAEIAGRLRHPNIVTVYESRTLADGRTALVMEFVEGVPLDRWTPPGADDVERRRALLGTFVEVCEAVHHAHLNGVIHRDLKPDNIFVRGDGHPVVLDFGVAKADHVQATMTGEFAGTPAYASPEQASGHPDRVDALTDVYSLGVILYKLLCDRFPYELTGSIMEIARTITESPPVPPRKVNPTIPVDLEAVVLRALRKEKELRYHSAADLARDLRRYLDGHPVEARSDSGWYVVRKAIALNRRRLVWFGVAAGVIAAAIVAVGMSLASAAEHARRESVQREIAQAENMRARAVSLLLRDMIPLKDPAKPEITTAVSSGLVRLYLRLESGAFADEPDLDQAVRRIWGGVYTGLGEGRAADLAEYSEVSLRNGLVRLRERYSNVDHPDIAATLHELAGVLYFRKRYAESENVAEQAVDMRARLFGPSDAQTALSNGLRARALLALGRSDEADTLSRATIALLVASPGHSEDPMVATLLALRARIALDARDAASAEPLIVETFARRFRTIPPEDPELTSTLTLAADLVELSPDRPLSRQLQAAWSAEQQSDAPLHDRIRETLGVLSTPDSRLFTLSGEPPTGRTIAFGRMLAIQRLLLGENDPSTVGTLMARARAAQNEILPHIRAECYLRAGELLERRFGPNDLSVMMCAEQAASVFAFFGKPDRAVEQGKLARDIWSAVPEHARDDLLAANCTRRLGWFLVLANRHAEAVEVLDRAIVDLRQAVGEPHYLVSLAQAARAFALLSLGDIEQADRVSDEAARFVLSPGVGPIPGDTNGHILFVRGHVLTAIGRHAEAIPMLQRSWDVAYFTAPPVFTWRALVLRDLLACATALHDTESRERWSRQIETDLSAPQPSGVW